MNQVADQVIHQPKIGELGDIKEELTTIKSRVKFLLETEPKTRNDYAHLMARYWIVFNDMPEGMTHAEFIDWFTQREVASAKSIQNRCLELQRENPYLDSEDAVRQWRDWKGRNPNATAPPNLS